METVTAVIMRKPLVKRTLAALFLLAFLAIHSVAASDSLHHALHPDSKSPNHHCVFVHVLNGHCLGETQPTVAPAPIESTSFTAPVIIFRLSSRDYVLPPGRAPPVSLA